jgi:hypothetical protein
MKTISLNWTGQGLKTPAVAATPFPTALFIEAGTTG